MYGSLVNSLSGSTTVPEIGMGVTFLSWSDRSAGTIVEVSKDKKTITVQSDNSKRVDNNGMSESQTYEFTPNPNAPKRVYTLRKNGHWVVKGQGFKNGSRLVVGYRDKYYDYSF